MPKIIAFALCLLYCMMFACTPTTNNGIGISVQPDNKLDTLVNMTAIVNGHTFKTDSVFGYNVAQINNDSPAVVNISVNATERNKDSISTISFSILNYKGPAFYTIHPPNISASWYLGNKRHFAKNGIITILSDTAYALKGTFYFTTDSIAVTNGKFNVLKPF